jgi:hypothetical protein
MIIITLLTFMCGMVCGFIALGTYTFVKGGR